MTTLPEGWKTCKLGDFLSLRNGFAFKSSDYKDEGIPVVRISDIQDGIVKTDNAVRVSDKQAKEGFYVEKGDVLVAMSGATTGKIGRFVSHEVALQNQRVGNLVPKDPKISKSFIYYWILVHKKEIEEMAYGGAQPNISSKLIEEIETRLPPLHDRQRIVAKLDTLFGHLDQLKGRLEKIPALLKQFRQAVLTQAVTGKLTEEVANWQTVTIEHLTCFIGSGITPKGGKENYFGKGIPFIRSMNVYPEGLCLHNLAFITNEMHNDMERTKVREGDVLLNITGASIGRATYVPQNFGQANVNQHVCILRTNALVLPEYLAMYLNSSKGQSYIMGTQTGMTRQGLNYSQIRAMPIDLPGIAEQEEIVRRVQFDLTLADRVNRGLESLVAKIDELPRTILTNAFRGDFDNELSNYTSWADKLVPPVEP